MATSPAMRKTLNKVGTELAMTTIPLLAHSDFLRHFLIQTAQKYIQNVGVSRESDFPRPLGVSEDRAEFSKVIMNTADRVLSHNLARPVLRSAARTLVGSIMVEGSEPSISEKFNKENGTNPPGFLLVSPGKTCNLRCTGCYANSGADAEKLDWDTFDKIITDAKNLWGVHFIAISGGEPMAYRSDGKGILDIAEKHQDVFFLMYTNGTLITEDVAKRMAKSGNLTPAISVEGWRERTDERRGAGVFDKVLAAMGRLRRAGVPFGISLTATRHNAEEIFSDEFLDFFFEEQGALYGWLFHYMPIGRSYTLDLMPTAEQRVWMWKRVWEVIHQRHIFMADFWNSATLTDGCLAAGRSNGGGYLYIDWNGAVSPCVFVPYSPVNICKVYANGGSLTDAWKEPFFSGIRNWQENYRKNDGNLLAPCIIRDHHKDLRSLISQHEPDPTDENARKALLDPNYARGLEEFDVALQTISDPIWQEYYLHPTEHNDGHKRPQPEKLN